MIDFHTHILPGIDDGSRDIEETEKLIQTEKLQGVGRILLTPHFYADREQVGRFLERCERSLEEVRTQFPGGEGMPELRAAAEVYYFPHMGKASMLPSLCMENSSLIMVELPFVQWTEQIYRDLEQIIVKQKLTVLLAHIDRYPEFQKDRSIWEEIMKLPLYVQINTGAFLKMRRRQMCLKFLKEGYPVVLGTDCHNMTSRAPNMEAARAMIEKKMGRDILDEIDRRGRELWSNGQ